MALYLDLHYFEEISMEDLKRDHMADIAVQDKHGVRLLQFWVNKEAGAVYCLFEGPNPEACAACHREAHGNIFCNIQEVEPAFFNLFMGEGQPVKEDMTLSHDGQPDPGERTLLVVDITGQTGIQEEKTYKNLQIPTKPKDMVMNAFYKFHGRFYQNHRDDSLVGVFEVPVNAIRCGVHIRNEILRLAQYYGENSEWNVNFGIGVNKGSPLTRDEGFFEVALEHAKRLSLIARPKQIVLSANLNTLYDEMEFQAPGTSAKISQVLSPTEEDFIDKLFEEIEQKLTSPSLSVNHLGELMGMSRTQIYRKIAGLTGKSPNEFIKFVRMNKALSLLKSKEVNISEIAMEVGYSNPSYFTKVFNGYFGYPPSAYYAKV